MAGVQLGFIKYVLGFDSLLFKKGISSADADLAKLQKSFQRSAAKMASLGKGLTLGLTAPLTAFGVASFDAAKDAAELQSSFNTTFGPMAKQMNAWAEATGNAMGRATQEMQKAANTFGIFFNTAVDPAKAAAMSRTFSTLAQDLGSFFNVDTETAIEKLRAGLSGEAEPLRAFGVFLSEAAVSAKAAELGIGGMGQKLTEQQKIMARAAIILEQTSKAQGDVGRTSAGTANQIRAAQAAWQELQVTVGTKLLPLLTPLISKIAELLNWFNQLPAPVKNVALAIAGVTAVAGPFLIAMGAAVNLMSKSAVLVSFAKALTGVAAAEGIAATGAAGLAAAMRTLWASINPLVAVTLAVLLAFQNWDKIKPIVQRMVSGVADNLRNNLARELDAVRAKVKAVADSFRWLYDVVVGHSYVPDMVAEIGAVMRTLDAAMVAPAKAAALKTAAAMQALRDKVRPLLAELYPDAEQQNQLADKVNLLNDALNKGVLSSGQWLDAVGRVTGAFEVSPDLGAPLPVEDLTGSLESVVSANDNLVESARMTKGEVIRSFGDMAAGVIGSMRGLADQLKSGDILGAIQTVLQTVLSVVDVLGRTGVIKLPGMNGEVTPRARGGPVVPGRQYLVGENGPEFVSFGRRGYVSPPRNGVGAGRVTIVPSPYFDVHVEGRAARVAAPMAGQAALAGAAGGAAAVSRRNDREFP